MLDKKKPKKSPKEPGSMAYFVFWGCERPWRPLKGRKAPPGKVAVLRSLPGGVVAAGKTVKDAQAKLQELLEREFQREGLQAWWVGAMKRLSPQDRQLLGELWARVREEGHALAPLDHHPAMHATLVNPKIAAAGC